MASENRIVKLRELLRKAHRTVSNAGDDASEQLARARARIEETESFVMKGEELIHILRTISDCLRTLNNNDGEQEENTAARLCDRKAVEIKRLIGLWKEMNDVILRIHFGCVVYVNWACVRTWRRLVARFDTRIDKTLQQIHYTCPQAQ